MKQILIIICSLISTSVSAQIPTEMYDLVKKLIYDSTGYENVGDWNKKFPVKWKSDRVEMSEDTSINFFRLGKADLTVKGKKLMRDAKPVTWDIMLKGPRMGYTSFSMISSPVDGISLPFTIDSLFGRKRYRARLLKACDDKDLTGFYYYELKVPGKDIAFIKVGWLSVNGLIALRIDGYDGWSHYAAKLDCR